MAGRLVKTLIAPLSTLLLGASAPADPPKDYAHAESAIVRVECGRRVGTASRVGHDTYISVHHVTRTPDCLVDGQPIEVTYSNEAQDFSTFRGPAGTTRLAISCEGFKVGGFYIARGYASGGYSLFFQPLQYVTGFRHYSVFIGDLFPGMSGGPILDSKGRITGTVNIGNPSGGVDLRETPVCGKGNS